MGAGWGAIEVGVVTIGVKLVFEGRDALMGVEGEEGLGMAVGAMESAKARALSQAVPDFRKGGDEDVSSARMEVVAGSGSAIQVVEAEGVAAGEPEAIEEGKLHVGLRGAREGGD